MKFISPALFAVLVVLAMSSAQAVPLTITAQPESQTIIVDDFIYMEVSTDPDDPGDGTYSYQWFKNGKRITDGTGTEYFYYVPDATINDAGAYHVVVSTTTVGSATSMDATVTVLVPPAITQSPLDKTVILGAKASFTAKASGSTPLSYQWYLFDAPIDGATGSNLTVANAQASDDQNQYSVVVSNAAVLYGADPAVSDYATLSVLIPPTIINQPYFDDGTADATNVVGDDVSLTVDVDLDTTTDIDTCLLKYQWFKNGLAIIGETDDTLDLLEVDASDAGNYSVRISNCAGSITSSTAKLTVLVPPTITQDPQDAAVKINTIATFTTKATGTPPLYYQWYFGIDPIPGATNSSINYSNSTLSFLATTTDQTGFYWVEVSNSVDVADSALAEMRVVAEIIRPAISITSPKEGFRWTNSPTITVTGKASDNAGIRSIEFQYNGSDFSSANITTANNWTNWVATFPAAPGTNTFRAHAIDTSGNNSTFVSLHVFYPVPSPFTLLTNGLGSVTPNPAASLEIGRGYRLAAKPGLGQVFAGWDMGVISTNPTLNFIMQPNLMLRVNFIPNPFNPVKGTYNGLFYQPTGVTHDTSGFFTLKLTPAGLYSGKLLMGGGSSSFTGGLWVNGASTTLVLRKGKPTLTLTLLIDLTNGTDRATGTVTASGLYAPLSGDRLVFSTSTNPAIRFAGKYTLALLHLDNDASVPAGEGVGNATVSPGGTILLAGTLADGVAIKQSVGVSKDGQWPFYVNLYAGKGSALGWLTFTNLVTNSIAGDVSWIKTPLLGKYYSNGFATQLEARGSHYSTPPAHTRVLNISTGEVVLADGGLSAPLTNATFLTTNNALITVTNNKLSLKLTLSTGRALGTFIHPDTKLSSKINGVVLPEDNTLRGFFLSTNLSGSVILLPAP